ncbi:MAG: alpha-amylase family protein [Gemmatimonadaceae bacterium]
MIADLWYKNAVIYSLDLESFMDSNGDGVGDFEGLSRRLDYLEALGVDAVWLAPFQPTPNRDNGYDVSDYYGVDPRHGSSGDFVEFMHQAGNRGIKVLIDLVVNHTSSEHRWFQSARSDPQSQYRDWYCWSKKRPKDWNKGMVFPGVQTQTWTFDEKAEEWYFHRFYDFQPDLNMDNPDVRAEIRRIIGYWLQLGVAGFRVDAVPFVLESVLDGKVQPELDFDYLYDMHRFMQWRRGDGVLLGEANVPPVENKRYFGAHGAGIQMMFNFWVNQRLFYALATGDARPLSTALRQTRQIPGMSQWAHFLRNHDELDLGRLSESQREEVFARFAPEERMQLYHRGIRRRLAPMLGDRAHIELAYSLLFALPGSPVLRYGDEIGMGDDLSLRERDAVRTPMQWSDERNAGFSFAERTVLPVQDRGPFGYQAVNVEAQRRDPDSLLNFTRNMIRLRQETPEIGWGDWTILTTGSRHVLAMRYDWRGNSVVTVHNFADGPREVRLRVGAERGQRLTNLIEQETLAGNGDMHHIRLDAHGFGWFRVGGLNHVARRERA